MGARRTPLTLTLDPPHIIIQITTEVYCDGKLIDVKTTEIGVKLLVVEYPGEN